MTGVVNAKMPRMMKPKCDTEVYAISRRMSSWPIASRAP